MSSGLVEDSVRPLGPAYYRLLLLLLDYFCIKLQQFDEPKI
jgi:hypothetical protein